MELKENKAQRLKADIFEINPEEVNSTGWNMKPRNV